MSYIYVTCLYLWCLEPPHLKKICDVSWSPDADQTDNDNKSKGSVSSNQSDHHVFLSRRSRKNITTMFITWMLVARHLVTCCWCPCWGWNRLGCYRFFGKPDFLSFWKTTFPCQWYVLQGSCFWDLWEKNFGGSFFVCIDINWLW